MEESPVEASPESKGAALVRRLRRELAGRPPDTPCNALEVSAEDEAALLARWKEQNAILGVDFLPQPGPPLKRPTLFRHLPILYGAEKTRFVQLVNEEGQCFRFRADVTFPAADAQDALYLMAEHLLWLLRPASHPQPPPGDTLFLSGDVEICRVVR